VGTAFDVRIDGGRVQVTMLEGTVRVERNAQGEAASSPADAVSVRRTRAAPRTVVATITAGEQLTVLDEHQDRIQVTEPDRVTSWRRGQVVFEDSRLEAVAAKGATLENIFEAVANFCGGTPLNDDCTVVELVYTG
jgi:ferric-dicitrate binding protein FerR (iron transport regulator)